jgi:hypothetical protein
MPIVTTLSYLYYPGPNDPVGFEMTLAVSDTVNGGGAGSTFTTALVITPGSNCTAWSQNPAHATKTGGLIPTPPQPVLSYNPSGITATWTGRVSNQAGNPSTFALRGRFTGSGVVPIQGVCTQMDAPGNSVDRQSLIPIPA